MYCVYENELAEEIVENVVSDIGALFGPRVYGPAGFLELLSSESLPDAPLHAVVRIDPRPGRPEPSLPHHFAYLRLNAKGCLKITTNLDSGEHRGLIDAFSFWVLGAVGGALKHRKISADETQYIAARLTDSATFSINHLCGALGTTIAFDRESVVMTALQIKREGSALGEAGGACAGGKRARIDDEEKQAEHDWFVWLVGVVGAPLQQSNCIRENRFRATTMMESLVWDMCRHLPPRAGQELVKKWERLLEGRVAKRFQEEDQAMFEDFGEMGPSLFTATWGWVSVLSLLFPLVQHKSWIPTYKVEFYSKAALDKSGGFVATTPGYISALRGC